MNPVKRHGLLNAPLNALIAELGHTDTLVIADAGLPIPSDVPRIDLAITPGLPGFLPVLDALLEELCVESVTLASEITTHSPALNEGIQHRLTGLEARPTGTGVLCASRDLQAIAPPGQGGDSYR